MVDAQHRHPFAWRSGYGFRQRPSGNKKFRQLFE